MLKNIKPFWVDSKHLQTFSVMENKDQHYGTVKHLIFVASNFRGLMKMTLAHFFGVHAIPWLKTGKKTGCKFFNVFPVKLYVMLSFRIASSRRF